MDTADAVPAWRKLWRDIVRVDRSQVVFWTALGNAIGVFIPPAVEAATGQLLWGLTASTGALQVAFADRPGPYRRRAGRMLLASLAGMLSVFVGAATGTVDWLAAEWARNSGVVPRIDLDVYVENDRARHLYEKFGFAVEGRRRHAIYRDGAYHDDLIMGLLL